MKVKKILTEEDLEYIFTSIKDNELKNFIEDLIKCRIAEKINKLNIEECMEILDCDNCDNLYTCDNNWSDDNPKECLKKLFL